MCGFGMRLKRLRWGAQISAFVVSNIGLNWAFKTGCLYPYLYCSGCPLSSGACPIGSLQHFISLPMFPLYIIGLVGLYGLIFGRTLCGWACPFGAFSDLLSKPAKVKARAMPQTKFLMLIAIVILAWITSETFFCKFCPSGSLFAAIPAPFFYEGLRLGTFYYVHLLTLAIIVMLLLVLPRFWCRYICPYGITGIFNKISLITISHDNSKCNECGNCLNVCPMGINKIHKIGKSTDCILCGRCIDECQARALKYSIRFAA